MSLSVFNFLLISDYTISKISIEYIEYDFSIILKLKNKNNLI